MIALALALPSAFAAAQGAGTSLEALLRDLENRTLARRTAAAVAWSEHAAAYLAGDAERLTALLAAAPEVQEPALLFLRRNLTKESLPQIAPAVLLFLGRAMNSAGAEELMELLPLLPASSQPLAVRAVFARGGEPLWPAGLALADGPPGPLRQAAVQTLLLHGPREEGVRLATLLSASESDLGSLSETLRALTAMPLAEAFRLPPAVLNVREPGFQREIATFLTVHPQDDAQDFLTLASLDPARTREERVVYLAAFEAGALAFRWKDGERAFEDYLEEVPRTESSEEVAWTLHRLSSRNGKRYLLEELEREARDNPDSWRDQRALARRQVDVGDHSDAFRGYRSIFEMLTGTNYERALSGEDYVWAARAAAGARHPKEAGQWLEASGLNAVELMQYKDLPEFAPLLDKQPFKRLFGTPD
jgi:hypothetical protein